MCYSARPRISVIAIAALSLAMACAPIWVQKGRLPKAGPAPVTVDHMARPTAALLLNGTFREIAPRDLVRRVTEEEAPFRAFDIVAVEPPPDAADYRITLDLFIRREEPKTETGPVVRYVLLGFATMLTFGLVPFPLATYDVRFRADVRDSHDTVVSKYVFEDSIEQVQQTFTVVLPLVIFYSAEGAALGTAENMLRTLYRRMAADGLLRAASKVASR